MPYVITLDDATERRLHRIAFDTDRPVQELIENAASEAALDYFRGRQNDPGRAPCPAAP